MMGKHRRFYRDMLIKERTLLGTAWQFYRTNRKAGLRRIESVKNAIFIMRLIGDAQTRVRAHAALASMASGPPAARPEPPSYRTRQGPLSDLQIAEIFRLADHNHSVATIARTLGIPSTRITYQLNKRKRRAVILLPPLDTFDRQKESPAVAGPASGEVLDGDRQEREPHTNQG